MALPHVNPYLLPFFCLSLSTYIHKIVHAQATKMEAWARMVLARKALARSRFAATKLQALVRGWLARRRFLKARAAATAIEATARGAAARAAYRTNVARIVRLQVRFLLCVRLAWAMA
jgi:IQ calmodulin-binding motif